MRVTVCQTHNDPEKFQEDWKNLGQHIRRNNSELVLLPELPFFQWLPYFKIPDQRLWEQAVEQHQTYLSRLPELGAEMVLATRPVVEDGKNINAGFIWTRETGLQNLHTKYYLPNEAGFWEARWYRRGEKEFSVKKVNGIVCAMLICTEMWFTEHARHYARQGIHILASPRATDISTIDKWLAGGRTAAVMSGAFCLSSNRGWKDKNGMHWGGLGWVIEPDGEVLATTSEEDPFVTVDIDLNAAEHAKTTYPRYVRE